MALFPVATQSAPGIPHGAGITGFIPICGHFLVTTVEAEIQYLARTAWGFSDLWVRVEANTLDVATAIRFRIDGANGNQSVSIPAGTTGDFEDTTNTDSVTSGERINTSDTVPAGSGTITINGIAYTCEDTDGDIWPLGAFGSIGLARGALAFHGVNGSILGTSVDEVEHQYRLRNATTFSRLRVKVTANGVSEASFAILRLNGADGNLSATILANTSAEFEDTTNVDVVSANTLINDGLRTGMGAHNDTQLDWRYITLLAEGTERVIISGTEDNVVSGGTTLSHSLESEAFGTTQSEANAQLEMRQAYDFSNLFFRVDSSLADASTFTLRKNGADTTITVSIPGSTSGEFEDTTNTESLLAADLANYRLVLGAGGNFSYHIFGIQAIEGAVAEFPPIRPMDQLHPRAAARAAPYSRWIDNLLAVEERVFPPIRPMAQLHPRAAARAAPYSYWHDNLLAVGELEFPPIRPMAQLHPRAAPRGSPLLYWIDNLLAVEEFPPIQPMPQLLPRAAPRGSPLLYWHDNLLAVEERVFPPIRPMDQLHPRAAARAAPYSYWHDNLLAVEEVLAPPIRPMDQLHPRAALRGSPLLYWIDNLLAVPEIAAITVELSYVIDVIIGSPAVGFQEKELILKRMLLKVLQLKDLIGPD